MPSPPHPHHPPPSLTRRHPPPPRRPGLVQSQQRSTSEHPGRFPSLTGGTCTRARGMYADATLFKDNFLKTTPYTHLHPPCPQLGGPHRGPVWWAHHRWAIRLGQAPENLGNVAIRCHTMLYVAGVLKGSRWRSCRSSPWASVWPSRTLRPCPPTPRWDRQRVSCKAAPASACRWRNLRRVDWRMPPAPGAAWPARYRRTR